LLQKGDKERVKCIVEDSCSCQGWARAQGCLLANLKNGSKIEGKFVFTFKLCKGTNKVYGWFQISNL